MARVAPFDTDTERYEEWFARHEAAYRSEVRALRDLLPRQGRVLEIGVGTARFARPLGIEFGIDPSPRMLAYAVQRGVKVARAIAEALPFPDAIFDSVLIVTTICFVDDVRSVLRETSRVLKRERSVVIGFVDQESHLGRHYLAHQHESVFYREAVFYSADEVSRLLSETGFERPSWRQTLTRPLADRSRIERPRPGFGSGAFVAVRAFKRY